MRAICRNQIEWFILRGCKNGLARSGLSIFRQEFMASTALDYITVRGFKSIASIEKLPLKSVNILIGSNGSGKSNFIGVFAFLHVIREGRLRDYVIEAGGAEKVLHFGSKTTKQIDMHLSFKE